MSAWPFFFGAQNLKGIKCLHLPQGKEISLFWQQSRILRIKKHLITIFDAISFKIFALINILMYFALYFLAKQKIHKYKFSHKTQTIKTYHQTAIKSKEKNDVWHFNPSWFLGDAFGCECECNTALSINSAIHQSVCFVDGIIICTIIILKVNLMGIIIGYRTLIGYVGYVVHRAVTN